MNRQQFSLAAGWFALLSLGITGAWWARPGYVWLLDSVWGPHQPVDLAHPSTITVWQIVVAGLTRALTASVGEKLTITLILIGLGLGAYVLLSRLVSPLWAWAGATVYLLNPFVYERLLAGQFIVLAGYAVLPVAVAALLTVLGSSGRRGKIHLAVLIAVYPLISPHYAYLAFWLLLAIALSYLAVKRPPDLKVWPIIRYLLATAGSTLIVNSFWLIRPLGGGTLQPFTTTDFANFHTSADPQLGVWINVLSLYGFWRGSTFIEPKTYVPWWWLITIVLLGLSVVGLVRLYRTRHPLGLALAVAGVVSVILAVGYASPIGRPLIDALIHFLPGFRGLRESGKLIGVLALVYVVSATIGTSFLMQKLKLPWANKAGACALALTAVMSTTGIWAGYGGQVQAADYPAGWYEASRRVTSSDTILVLPWHGYLSVNFAGAYVAQPAPVFFSSHVLTGNDLDNGVYNLPPNDHDRLMHKFITGQISPADWVQALKRDGVTKIFVEKTDDWQSYSDLVGQARLNALYQDNSVELYAVP